VLEAVGDVTGCSTTTFGGGTALRARTGSSGREGSVFLSSEAPGRRKPWKRSVMAAMSARGTDRIGCRDVNSQTVIGESVLMVLGTCKKP
jgi:hypothetical protein